MINCSRYAIVFSSKSWVPLALCLSLCVWYFDFL